MKKVPSLSSKDIIEEGVINFISRVGCLAHLPSILSCLLVSFSGHLLAQFRRFNYLAINTPTSDPGDEFFNRIDFCPPEKCAIKLRFNVFRRMPVTLTHPPFHSLAETQCNQSGFIFFIKPDAPGTFKQFDSVKIRRNLKSIVSKHNAFNTLQFPGAKLPRRVRVTNGIGTETNG